MRKLLCISLLLIALPGLAHAWPGSGYKRQVPASAIDTDTSNFNGNCNSGDNTVQKCLDKLDDAAGGGSVSDAAYGVAWNGDTTTAASKNALYDKIETIASGGEVNTASNLGGGLDNFSVKSGVDLRFNTFSSTDFDLASNLITIDAAIARDAEIAAAYQPLDSDLTYLAGFTPAANVKSILNAADYAAIRTLLGLVIGTNVQAYDADLDYLSTFTPAANVKSILNAADYSAIRTLLSLVPGTNVQAFDSDLATLAAPTAWRVFYSDGSGNIAQLALGASGTFLKSNGAANVPSFATPAGTGDMLASVYDPAGIVEQLVGLTATQTLTNKSVNADNNTITNIDNGEIKAAAAIALNKLAATTASRALVSDGSGFVSAATTTSTEIGYVNGVTSAIQTQFTGKISQSGAQVYAADSVGSDSYAITLSPALGAYAAGNCFTFSAGTANTGAATLNVNALGAKTIKKQNDQDLADNDIEVGQTVTVCYDGTNFQMQSQIANTPTASAKTVYATSVPLASATRYVSPFSQTQDATATNVDDFEVPYTCTAKNLRFRVQSAPGLAASGKAYTATMWTGAAGSASASALTAQVFEVAVNNSDTTHTVTLTAGNVVFFELLRTGSATASNASVSFECD